MRLYPWRNAARGSRSKQSDVSIAASKTILTAINHSCRKAPRLRYKNASAQRFTVMQSLSWQLNE